MWAMVCWALSRAATDCRDLACFFRESSTVCTSSTRLKPEHICLTALQAAGFLLVSLCRPAESDWCSQVGGVPTDPCMLMLASCKCSVPLKSIKLTLAVVRWHASLVHGKLHKAISLPESIWC